MKILLGFAGGLLVILVLLAIVPHPISEKLSTLRDDGLRLAQVYQRIVQDPRPIDVAFIGTSHTMNGIDDRGIEETLAKAGIQVHVANLGVIFMGRDLHLFLIKELLESKAPRLIVLEINEHEPPYGHPLMPYVASASDFFCCEFWTELNFPKMLLLFLKEQLHECLSFIWPSSSFTQRSTLDWQYGWLPINLTWQPEVPHHSSLGDKLENLRGGNRVRKVAYKILSKYGYQAVRQIVELAYLNHVKVVFLYLPEYAYATNPRSDDIRFYTDLGSVLFPPQNVVADRLNWWDFAHLNKTGSRELVPAVSAAIAQYLRSEGTASGIGSGAARTTQ
jgi:hypothetical protein